MPLENISYTPHWPFEPRMNEGSFAVKEEDYKISAFVRAFWFPADQVDFYFNEHSFCAHYNRGRHMHEAIHNFSLSTYDAKGFKNLYLAVLTLLSPTLPIKRFIL